MDAEFTRWDKVQRRIWLYVAVIALMIGAAAGLIGRMFADHDAVVRSVEGRYCLIANGAIVWTDCITKDGAK